MPISVITIEVLSSIGKMWLGIGDEPDRGDDCRDGQQHRDPGGDERAEGDDEDHQRHGQGQRLGPLQIVARNLSICRADARVAELLDPQLAGVPAGAWAMAFCTGATRSPAVAAAPLMSNSTSAEWPSFETRPASPLSVAALMLRTTATCATRARTSRIAAANAGSDGLQGRARDERLLLGRLGEVLLERLLRAARLAGVLVCLAQLVRPDHAADHDGRDDEHEPAREDRLLVPRAPAAYPGGDSSSASCTQHVDDSLLDRRPGRRPGVDAARLGHPASRRGVAGRWTEGGQHSGGRGVTHTAAGRVVRARMPGCPTAPGTCLDEAARSCFTSSTTPPWSQP